MARRVVDAYVVTDLKGASAAVAEMAELDRRRTLIEVELAKKIDRARAEAAQAAAGMSERYRELEKAVCVFARLRREELFTDGKTIDLGAGKIGFRVSMPSIVQERGVTVEMTLARLRELGFADGIRVKESLAKDVMLGWTDEQLALAGCKRRQAEEFFVDIPRESVPEGV